MPDEDNLDEVDQYSDASRERVRQAAMSLMDAIERHMVALLDLSGGTSVLDPVFELNNTVEQAAAAWDDALFDHTGVFPLALDVGEPDDEEDDEEAESEREPAETISVVARWDLDVVNVVDLVEAGREGHRRLDPAESRYDAVAAIEDNNVGQALYTLVHEIGEPWFEIPGVEVVGGLRAYLRRDPDGPVAGAGEDDDAFVPIMPNGEVLFSESW